MRVGVRSGIERGHSFRGVPFFACRYGTKQSTRTGKQANKGGGGGRTPGGRFTGDQSPHLKIFCATGPHAPSSLCLAG